MKTRFSKILKQCIQGFIEIITFFPIFLMFSVYISDKQHLKILMLASLFMYIIGIIYFNIFSNAKKYINFILGISLAGILLYLILGLNNSSFILWPIFAILFFRGIYISRYGWYDKVYQSLCTIGFFIYFICYFLFKHLPKFKPFLPSITWMGIIFTFTALIILNINQLRSATLSEKANPYISHTMLKHNLFIITITYVLIFIISSYNTIKNGFLWIISKISYLLSELFSILQTPVKDIKPNSTRSQLPFIPEENEPSKFVEVMEVIFKIIALIVLVVLIFYAIKKLFKLLQILSKQLLKFIKNMFKEDGRINDEGFEDEKEKLMNLSNLATDYKDKLKKWLSKILEKEPKWKDLKTNREKIRFIYRHFILKCISDGYKFKTYLTPNEIKYDLNNLDQNNKADAENITSIYNIARYSNKKINIDKIKNRYPLS